MNRNALIDRLFHDDQPWDILVIGGGATGMGIAVDAASRGYRVALVEQSDFGKSTSARSTKLVHGGVRYLQQGNISLVMEALRERGLLRANAPHLVHDLAFVVPNYDWWEAPFYGIGMKVYDLLAGRYGFGKSRILSRSEIIERLPTLDTSGLRGGVLYYDGQFDDARLLINLAQTAVELGAVIANYVRAENLTFDANGFVDGASVIDLETSRQARLRAKVVINATGAFSDSVRRMDDPAAQPMIAPSQGVHIVLDSAFLGRNTAIMVPRTSDGRVMFAIPWHGYSLIGTTDTPIDKVLLEPVPLAEEVDFILETAGRYLAKPPSRSDVLSMWAGIRPLVRAGDGSSTAALSRDHTIHISKSGLLTIAGGKWTTYRKMAEDCVDHAAMLGRLDERPCTTRSLHIHGYQEQVDRQDELHYYGSDAAEIEAMIRENPSLGETIDPIQRLRGAQVVWAVRREMARTVDDVLARRTRWLQLDARSAAAAAPRVAAIMAQELGRDQAWVQEQVRAFVNLAGQYQTTALA